MLPKSRRLDRRAFDAVRLSKLVSGDSRLSLRFRDAPPPGRFSMVIPKSVCAQAVERNRVRRALYDVVSTGSWPFNGILYVRRVAPLTTITSTFHTLLVKTATRYPALNVAGD
jgi:ribonuclease P protein component